jgi:hypothetical protein
MKKVCIAVVTMVLATSTYAKEAKFVNGDGSAHSEICIAAIQSDQALKAKSEEHGYSSAKMSQLSCNGMSIGKFAKMYRNQAVDADNKAVKVFSFDNEMQNLEADVCIAAASSNEKYAAIRKGLTKPKSYYRTITCNGMPLASFAKKYGNKSFKM